MLFTAPDIFFYRIVFNSPIEKVKKKKRELQANKFAVGYEQQLYNFIQQTYVDHRLLSTNHL